MNAKRKAPPAPDMGGISSDWDRYNALREKEHGTVPAEAAAPAAPSEEAPAPTPPRPEPEKPKAAPTMTRRSWYAETTAVEGLAEVVDDLHHKTRVPKHVVVAELFRAAAEAAPKVEKRLNKK